MIVVRRISDAINCLDLKVAGFIARPLYVCTAKVGKDLRMCMFVANMSKMIIQSCQRTSYRCRTCLDMEAGGGCSFDAPKRVLQLYALVHTGVSEPTPVRMRPVRLVVCAPPDQWAWGEDPSPMEVSLTPVSPKRGFDSRGFHWYYDKRESTAIWQSAGPYMAEGAPPL